MPLWNLQCPDCGKGCVRVRNTLAEALEKCCPSCKGYNLKREPIPPGTSVTEVLDNGHMTKKLERPAQAEELTRQHEALDRKQRQGD